jgi:hypothetical protein
MSVNIKETELVKIKKIMKKIKLQKSCSINIGSYIEKWRKSAKKSHHRYLILDEW